MTFERHCRGTRPVTARSECTADEAYRWSDGRAIFASGSPFPPVQIDGRTFVPGQGNNVYFFPAMGLAVFATEAARVTEEMFIVAAKAIAEQVTQQSLDTGLIDPPQSKIFDASLHVATRVADYIFDKNLARAPAQRHRRTHPVQRLPTRVRFVPRMTGPPRVQLMNWGRKKNEPDRRAVAAKSRF